MSFLGEGTLLENILFSKSLRVPTCRLTEGVHTLGGCTEGRVAQQDFPQVGLAGPVKARPGLGLQGVEGIDGHHHEVQGGA